MDHDWVAIGLGLASILISVASVILTMLAERRTQRNREGR